MKYLKGCTTIMIKTFKITSKLPTSAWEEEIMININIDGKITEFAIRFYKLLKDRYVARLEMFADAFEAFRYDAEFFKDLADYTMTSYENIKPTRDEVTKLLLKHNYVEE